MNEEEKEFNDIQLSAFLTKEEMLQAYRKLQQENQQLKENNQAMQEEMARSWEKVDLYKSVLDEAREFVYKSKVIVPMEYAINVGLFKKKIVEILDKVGDK